MRKLFCKFVLTGLAIVCGFSSQANAGTLTGGNAPVAAPLEDGASIYGSGLLLVDTTSLLFGNHTSLINETGTVTSWDIYVAQDRTASLVELVIFGPNGVVGHSALEQPTGPGLNTFTTSIAVQAGDAIGFFAPGFNPIEYNDGSNIISYSANNLGVPANDSGAPPFDHHIERIYSIDVHGIAAGATSVPEPSTFALLGFGGIGLTICVYRRRRIALV